MMFNEIISCQKAGHELVEKFITAKNKSPGLSLIHALRDLGDKG